MFIARFPSRILVLAALLGTGACGSGAPEGGSGAESNTLVSSLEHTVEVTVTDGGRASPDVQQVEQGLHARVEVSPDQGFGIRSISGCDGTLDGNYYTTGPVTADCRINVAFSPKGSVSGQLLPVPDAAVDQTLNDKRAPFVDNTQCDLAQAVDNRATVHGFASANATGGDPRLEHYAEHSNPSDFYRIALNAGQVVELQVADHQAAVNELELHLWSGDCSGKLASSTDGGETEQLVSLLGGEQVVEVRAKTGFSKYVLRAASVWENTYGAEELQRLSSELPEFVANEVILEFAPAAGGRPHEYLNEALKRVEGLQLRFRHQDAGRATLAYIEPQATVHVPSHVMEDLQERAPKAYEALNTLRIVNFLAQQPEVRRAEPNFRLRTQSIPNDPYYHYQWHYEQVNLPEAWDTTTGTVADGEDVIIAILDTGVYLAHEDIHSKLLPGHDFYNDDADPDDHNSTGTSSWHGTHVAGTAAASTNDGTGVAGVSWAAKIMPVRVLSDDGGTSYDVMQGVRYAAGLSNDSGKTPARPADVINLSLGGSGYSDSAQNLFNEVRAAGIFVVAAAGNDGVNAPTYPAAYEGVISVSATRCDKALASYSNYGPTITLAAPGGDSTDCNNGDTHVLSTVGTGSNGSRSSAYGWMIGTSMATPHVAGVIALMRAIYPSLSPENFDTLLLDGQITEDLGAPGRDDKFGHGLINSWKAVQAAGTLANNDEWSATVVADPATLYMGWEAEALLELSQDGEGPVPAVISWKSQHVWLTAVEEGVDTRGLGTYRVIVDRETLSEEGDGERQSELAFALEDGSELRVGVHVQVGTASAAAPVYVLLLNPDTQQPMYETNAYWNTMGELRYEIKHVAAGDYLLVAGSDIDADKLTCQSGEICGAFPSVGQPQLLTVTDGARENMDFGLDVLSHFGSGGGSGLTEAVPRK